MARLRLLGWRCADGWVSFGDRQDAHPKPLVVLVERLNVFQPVLGADEVLPVFQVADAGGDALAVFLDDEGVAAELVGVDVDAFQFCEHLLFGHACVFCGDVFGQTCAVE